MRQSTFLRELGRSGVFTFLFLAILAIVVTFLFYAFRPPTVDEVERDIWKDWVRSTVDSLDENIAGLVRHGRRAACQQLLRDFGEKVSLYGKDFVVRTQVRLLRVLDDKGQVFAEWKPNKDVDVAGYNWSHQEIPLADDGEAPIGTLEVVYKFNESTLEKLPNLKQLGVLHNAARWLVAIIAMVMLIAAIANLQRLRERAARLQSQQVTLDLARQMCHELRNGLWAFSLEGKNIQQLFSLIDDYFQREPEALAEAAQRIGLNERDLERLQRQVRKHLGQMHLDPQTDVLAANEMAKDAQQHIESFSRYINLTVEELDRNLLGASYAWEPVLLRASDAWEEACNLLHLRLHSAGVERVEQIESAEDWLRVDRRSLVHVFVNLAKNAVEAMRELPADRVLTFSVKRLGTWVECRVHNVGRPIPPTLLPFIFQRGFSTKAGAGRGLGLALVAESVERMHGTIEVSSGPDGTTFVVRLPSAQPEPAESSPSESVQPPNSDEPAFSA